MKSIKIIFFFFLIVFLSCTNSEKQTEESTKSNSIVNNKDFEWLLGKTIFSIDSILPTQIGKEKIVFIFNFYDCNTCVDAGFYVCKKIDNLFGKQVVFPIASIINNVTPYQSENKYYEYIYLDNSDLIRKEMKYIPTPVILRMDNKNAVTNIFFPKDTLETNYGKFIKSCL